MPLYKKITPVILLPSSSKQKYVLPIVYPLLDMNQPYILPTSLYYQDVDPRMQKSNRCLSEPTIWFPVELYSQLT